MDIVFVEDRSVDHCCRKCSDDLHGQKDYRAGVYKYGDA